MTKINIDDGFGYVIYDKEKRKDNSCKYVNDYYKDNFVGKIDFHIHSCNSDGESTVEEICELAGKQGLEVISITDHNKFTLDKPIIIDKLLVIPGVEFSTTYEMKEDKCTKEIHVIGLFPEGVDPQHFNELFENIHIGKAEYVRVILDDLACRNINISYEEVEAVTPKGKHPGRHQIGQVLIEKGYAQNMTEAFDKHIGNFSPYYIPTTKYIKYASLETVTKQIRRCNGIPILCHVYGYNFSSETEIEELIRCFKQYAGEVAAIEVYYERYLNEVEKISFLKSMAKRYGLLESAGSDKHSKEQPFATKGKMDLYRRMIKTLKINAYECSRETVSELINEYTLKSSD